NFIYIFHIFISMSLLFEKRTFFMTSLSNVLKLFLSTFKYSNFFMFFNGPSEDISLCDTLIRSKFSNPFSGFRLVMALYCISILFISVDALSGSKYRLSLEVTLRLSQRCTSSTPFNDVRLLLNICAYFKFVNDEINSKLSIFRIYHY